MGFSHAPNAADNIIVITNWPKSKDGSSEKMPSRVAYPAKDDARISHNESIFNATSRRRNPKPVPCRAGFDVDIMERHVQCFKLCLKEKGYLPKFVNYTDMQQLMSINNRRIHDVMTDYLNKIRLHVDATLGEWFRDEMPIHARTTYLLTVPAMWTER